jgi:hypothetical protein
MMTRSMMIRSMMTRRIMMKRTGCSLLLVSSLFPCFCYSCPVDQVEVVEEEEAGLKVSAA